MKGSKQCVSAVLSFLLAGYAETTTADELAAARHSVYQFWDITVSK